MDTVVIDFNGYFTRHFNRISFIPYVIYSLGYVLNVMFKGTNTIITPKSEGFIKSIEDNTYAIFINTNEPVDIENIAGNLALIYILNSQFPVIIFDKSEIVLKLLKRSEEILNIVAETFSEIEEPTIDDVEEILSEFMKYESFEYYKNYFNEKPKEGVSIIYLEFGFVIIKEKILSANEWTNFIFFIKEQGRGNKINTFKGLVIAFKKWNKKNTIPFNPNLN